MAGKEQSAQQSTGTDGPLRGSRFLERAKKRSAAKDAKVRGRRESSRRGEEIGCCMQAHRIEEVAETFSTLHHCSGTVPSVEVTS